MNDDPMLAAVKARKGAKDDSVAAAPPQQASGDEWRERTLMNMTRAMSGQKMDRPEDQAEAERGREAGMKAAARDLAITTGLGAVGVGLEALAGPRTVSKQVATGLVDELGNPIMRQKVVENVGRIPGLLKSAYDWVQANPVKAYLLYKVADEIGLGPSSLKKVFHLAAAQEP